MQEIIFIIADKWGVKKMTKNLPQLSRGEIPIKIHLKVEETAFREPVIEKHVTIEDWRQGVDIADVEFKEALITEEEAAKIRAMRLEKMRNILESQGYQVTKPEEKI